MLLKARWLLRSPIRLQLLCPRRLPVWYSSKLLLHFPSKLLLLMARRLLQLQLSPSKLLLPSSSRPPSIQPCLQPPQSGERLSHQDCLVGTVMAAVCLRHREQLHRGSGQRS